MYVDMKVKLVLNLCWYENKIALYGMLLWK
jgi:hypothetical protein